MSYKDLLLDGPANVPPELLESDDDDEEPTLTTEDTAGINWYFYQQVNTYIFLVNNHPLM